MEASDRARTGNGAGVGVSELADVSQEVMTCLCHVRLEGHVGEIIQSSDVNRVRRDSYLQRREDTILHIITDSNTSTRGREGRYWMMKP